MSGHVYVIRGIDLASFYYFSIEFWNCSDSVLYFIFNLLYLLYSRLLQEGSKSNLKQTNDLQPLRNQINKMYSEFKKDVESFESEKSGLSMDTLIDEPTQRDDVNIMMKQLTKIEQAYKVIKERDTDKKG